MKKIVVILSVMTFSTAVFATGGLTCHSIDSKLRFDVVESSLQTPVSAKLFYKTDAVEGEDGSVQSFDLRNSKFWKPIIYSQEANALVVVIISGSSVLTSKLDLSKMTGTAQAMISNEAKTLNIFCNHE